MDFKGGETEALKRLEYYLWKTDHLSRYKDTRNGIELGLRWLNNFRPSWGRLFFKILSVVGTWMSEVII